MLVQDCEVEEQEWVEWVECWPPSPQVHGTGRHLAVRSQHLSEPHCPGMYAVGLPRLNGIRPRISFQNHEHHVQFVPIHILLHQDAHVARARHQQAVFVLVLEEYVWALVVLECGERSH